MDKLLSSRKQKQNNSQKIESLSPQKYGKSAYYELSYTPSKLADNVLFREASNLKKIQEESCKTREFESQNLVLLDQVEYLKQERDGISASLNKIIAMYKQIIAEMETKNEERLGQIQKKFNEEVQRFIKDKEQEARFYQSEKEVLEQRIEELETEVLKFKAQISEINRLKSNLHNEYDQLNIKYKHTCEKLTETEQRWKSDVERAHLDYQQLKGDMMKKDVEWKNKLRDDIGKKEKQIETSQRLHKVEMENLENQRNTENMLKSQQITELTKTFDAQSKRLNQIINIKDQLNDQLSTQISKEKTRILNLTRQYETEINMLTHQKNRLFQQIEVYASQNEGLAKDKAVLVDDLESQNGKLRSLLYESSLQLQKCKGQLLGLAKDNSRLVNRVKSSQEEAKTWRQSYYLNKTRA